MIKLKACVFSNLNYIYHIMFCISLHVFYIPPSITTLKLGHGLPWFQVETIRKKLCLADDWVKVNCDAVSLRGFVSYLIHRNDGSKRRESRFSWFTILFCHFKKCPLQKPIAFLS